MNIATLTAPAAEFRAAGTDLSERRRSRVSTGPLIDIMSRGDSGISWGPDGAASIGALTTIAAIASDARLATAYPGIAASAQGLATPQVRYLATLVIISPGASALSECASEPSPSRPAMVNPLRRSVTMLAS